MMLLGLYYGGVVSKLFSDIRWLLFKKKIYYFCMRIWKLRLELILGEFDIDYIIV